MGDFSSEDVFIAGYPKSGSTWMQCMIVGAIFGLDLELTPDSLVQDLVPDVHYRAFFRRYLPFTVFKSHSLPQAEYRNVISLVRDGRDVMVSYFHYLSALKGQSVDFLKMVQTGEGLSPCKWHEHVEQWLTNPNGARLIQVRYEDLKGDAVGQLGRVCEWMGIKRERSVLERAVKKASFSAMRRREALFGWDSPDWPKDKSFVRRGEVGSHLDEMPEPVRRAFLREAGPTLEKLGYS